MPRQLVRGPSQPLCLPSHIRTILAAGPQAVVSSRIRSCYISTQARSTRSRAEGRTVATTILIFLIEGIILSVFLLWDERSTRARHRHRRAEAARS